MVKKGKSSSYKISSLKQSPVKFPPKRDTFIRVPKKQTSLSFIVPLKLQTFKESLLFDTLMHFIGYRHTSYLYQELRHKRGLLYSLGSYNVTFPGASLLYIATTTSRPKEVIPLVKNAIKNLGKIMQKKDFIAYKDQTLRMLELRLANPHSSALFAAENWIQYEKIFSPDDAKKFLQAASYQSVMAKQIKEIPQAPLFITALGEKNPFGK